MKSRLATINKEQENSRLDIDSSGIPDTIDELVGNLKEAAVTTRVPHLDSLGGIIHQVVLAIDSELRSAVDTEVRKQLVRIAYSLRDLEQAIIQND